MCVCAYKKTCKYVSYTAWDKANVYMLLSQTQIKQKEQIQAFVYAHTRIYLPISM